VSDDSQREEGPTEVVETDTGELIERLSGGTATLLLVWLVGVGALSTLLAAWSFVWIVSGERLGLSALFGGFGIYTSLAGASGPCVLWLAGRAQGHTLRWFLATSAKIALVMIVIVLVFLGLILLIMGGVLPTIGALPVLAIMVAMSAMLSVVWGAATWAADRWIARARLDDGGNAQTS
jgi:hypothetical protein